MVLFSIICLGALGYMLFLVLKFARATSIAKRASIKRMMSVAFGAMLLAVVSMGVVLAWDSVAAQASGGGDARTNISNYKLSNNSFEFREPEFAFLLLCKDEIVRDNVVWYIETMPAGVAKAGVISVNGRYLFSYVGLQPSPSKSYTFNLIASITRGDTILVSVPLALQIYNSAVPLSAV